ncbi:hypothetical protein SISSUDRAFT_569797 [Sistotremastrum suecicum HHB10207 ss-3]|uniref:Uncharacterized protein n=1 Tax=Sistotremastrum suecicum HHB10207 ss-3 TaxID=1314776 RepID=A0A165XH32_9AGAM|nr:hypothetical protein SISSUDRAFT_569797 [Sistotremastrum suecicum HHB10207 ss-3]
MPRNVLIRRSRSSRVIECVEVENPRAVKSLAHHATLSSTSASSRFKSLPHPSPLPRALDGVHELRDRERNEAILVGLHVGQICLATDLLPHNYPPIYVHVPRRTRGPSNIILDVKRKRRKCGDRLMRWIPCLPNQVRSPCSPITY